MIWCDVDDSRDILFLTLLRRWIQFSQIVNPSYLISYMFIIQYVYTFTSSDVIPWSSGTVLNSWPCVLMFYTVYPRVYILPVSPTWYIYITQCACNIEYACYVMSPKFQKHFQTLDPKTHSHKKRLCFFTKSHKNGNGNICGLLHLRTQVLNQLRFRPIKHLKMTV